MRTNQALRNTILLESPSAESATAGGKEGVGVLEIAVALGTRRDWASGQRRAIRAVTTDHVPLDLGHWQA
jgi:hypothetical protein